MSDDFRSFIERLDDAAIVIDCERHILQYNAAVGKRVVSSFSQIAGCFCYEALSCRSASEAMNRSKCPGLQAFASNRPVYMNHFRQAGNDSTLYEILAIPLPTSAGKSDRVVEIWRDITEVKQLKTDFQRRLRNLSALHFTGLIGSRTLSLDKVLNNTLDLILSTLHADAGGVYLLQEHNEEQVLRLKTYRSIAWEVAQDIDYLKLGEGFSGQVVQSGQSLIVEDVRSDLRLTRHLLNRENLRSMLIVPLKWDDQVIGTIWAASRQADTRFGEHERAWLTAAGAQLALAVENARLYEEVQQHELEQSRLLAHIIRAQEEERKRVARELHDETNQALTILALDIDNLMEKLESDPDHGRAIVKRLKMGVGHVIDNVQRVILDLRPGPLDDLGLIPALRWYATIRLEAAGIKVHFDVTGFQEQLSDEQEIALFRVIQEALNNIVQYSGASNVYLSIHFLGSKIIARIEDDGAGFNVDETLTCTDGRRGLGLLGMRERLVLIGGQLEVQSAPHKGTQIRIYIPLHPVEDQKSVT